MARVIPKKEQSAEKFSRRFRMLMAFHDLTLKDIAEATENAISTVGTWKNGRYPSSQKTVDKLCEIFQVTADYLLRGKKEDVTASGWAVEDMSAQILQQPQAMNAMSPAFYANRIQPMTAQPMAQQQMHQPQLDMQQQQIRSQVESYLTSLLAQGNNPQDTLNQMQRNLNNQQQQHSFGNAGMNQQ